MKKLNLNVLLFTLIAFVFLFAGCADVTPVQDCMPAEGHVYGFWAGTWHGMIMSFSFIGSLFSDDIAVYAVNNNGWWYDFGFIGGFFIMFKLVTGGYKKIK